MMTEILNRLNALIHDPQWLASMEHPCWPYPPTTLAVARACEAELGFRLPDLLRNIYTQVSNGGLGPPYGVFGLTQGAPAYGYGGETYDLVEYYYLRRGRQPLSELQHDFEAIPNFTLPYKQWFDKLLPVANGGCTYTYLLHCSKPSAPVLLLDDAGSLLISESPSYEAWIEEWLNGESERLLCLGPGRTLDEELKQLIGQGKDQQVSEQDAMQPAESAGVCREFERMISMHNFTLPEVPNLREGLRWMNTE